MALWWSLWAVFTTVPIWKEKRSNFIGDSVFLYPTCRYFELDGEIDTNEYIPCRSVRFGELILIGPKTHTPYRWANEGDIADVEFQDLMSWKALRHKYLFEPMIIIEDEDIVEEWKADLGKLYADLQDIDVKALFKLPQRQFVAQLKKLPVGMKTTV